MVYCVSFKGMDFEVYGNYSPGEPEILYLANGDPGHPGSPSEFEITQINWNGNDVTELMENICDTSEIESNVIEQIESNY